MSSHFLLSLLALLYAMSYLGRQLMAVMIEPIKAEFAVSDSTMGLLSGLLHALVLVSLALPAGRIADRLSRTTLLALASLIWCAAMLASGWASSFAWLLAARLLIAASEAPFMPASLSLIADLYAPKQRALAISCFSAAPNLCIILALACGAWLIEHYGWRSAFYICSLPALLLAFALAISLEPTRGRWDPPTPKESNNFRQSVQQLLRNRAFLQLILACGLATLSGYSFAMWNTSFLVRSHALSLSQAGLLAGIICGCSGALGMLCGGWLSNRFSTVRAHKLISGSGIVAGFFSLLFYLLWPTPSVSLLANLAVPHNLVGCGLFCFFSVWWVAPCFSRCTELVSAHTRATAMGLQTIATTLLGAGLGPFLTGIVSDLLLPWFAQESLRYALVLGGIPALVAIPLMSHALNAIERPTPARNRTALSSR